ncbi:sigma 54-interacting transcriptional regulator [Parafilimonas sp.]|uniref:sigma 54-interacting transcriptional regulator n=1 Tax=Parafilimonas sp. TaxID=1969739 RepID=UPI003F7FC996
MKEKILIVEDQFVEADYLRLMLTQAGYNVTGIARSVVQAVEMMRKEKPDFVLLDIFLKGKQTGIDLAKQLSAVNIPFVYLSANSNEDILNEAKTTEPYGFLVKPFREKDLLVTLEIARYRYKHSLESKYKQEVELKKEIKNIAGTSTNLNEALLKIATTLQKYIPFDYMAAGFDNIGQPSFHGTCFLRIGFNEYQQIGLNELMAITGKNLQELIALQSDSPKESIATVYNNNDFNNICRQPSLRKLFAETFQLKSHLEMPMFILQGKPFSFCLYSKIPDAYNASHINLFENAQMLLINSIEIMLNNKNNIQHKVNKIEKDEFIKGCEGIIGKSPLLLNVLDHIAQVAPSDTSVLILGESGTGKEKIADCIHNLSNRKSKPFIKVNCAALPATLIESELFGHEKGAFTGALDKRIGKFEKANGGTILLDEIGEMPLELQVKLLRVLQEKEIERIGGKDTIKIDVRIIAATNKNLEKEVAEARFRLDLYYRLNVFPIELPPLRERKEDIPALAYHFMNYYNNKTGKKIHGIADNVLKNMMAYSWRGNIRELEHLMERSVLLAKGNMIEEMPLPFTAENLQYDTQKAYTKTIHENERDYIISILKKCNGRIWGAGAAAEILNIPPSTLKSKMKKLGIKKEFIQ